MRRSLSLFFALLACQALFSQDSFLERLESWFDTNGISVRSTFDGSASEKKPATFAYRENHRSENDFLNVDMAIKIVEVELFKNRPMSLMAYPKVEWHKSTDTTNAKDKLDMGINLEFVPFALKSPDIDPGLPNKGWAVSPYIQGLSSFKRNFISKAYETKLTLQLSLISNYRLLPGYSFRSGDGEFIARYYPYFGWEHHRIPDLVEEGVTEEFSTYFFRFFLESWPVPRDLQLNLDWTYRRITESGTAIDRDLPIFIFSVNYYPGNQEAIGLGYEYKNGHDPSGSYETVVTSSLKLNVKF